MEHAALQLEEVPADRIAEALAIGRADQGIPAELQGLWWMDGNPLPDAVLTLGSSGWDVAQRRTRIHVYGERSWSWHPGLAGRALYACVRGVRLVYELRLDAAHQELVAVPILHLRGAALRVPEWLLRFSARRVVDGLWLRRSYVAGRLVHAYALRRIVRADGTREPAFAEYLETSPARVLVARRRDAQRAIEPIIAAG